MNDIPRDGQKYSAKITGANVALGDLTFSWATAEYTSEDGLAPLDSMHEAGDALVAVGEDGVDGMTIVGSGVMVAPGLLLTATHVLENSEDHNPFRMFMTFLDEGTRIWLPHASSTVSGESEFDPSRKLVSDISLISCTLNSDALGHKPLMIAPIRVALPLIGERLWAFGFRHQHIKDGVPSVTPFVSSGLVSGAFPFGRGEWMPAPCIEVEMDALGGMSGGPVFNEDGLLIGIVSSSIEGGPSYITLIYDVLRVSVACPPSLFENRQKISLMSAAKLGCAKINGEVEEKPWGDVVVKISGDEAALFSQSRNDLEEAIELQDRGINFTSAQIEDFAESYDGILDEFLESETEIKLNHLPLETALSFLSISDVPETCLARIADTTAEIFEGLEDFEIISIKEIEPDQLAINCYFQIRSLAWTISVPDISYQDHKSEFASRFMNPDYTNGFVTMELFQRCSFKVTILFDVQAEVFREYSVEWSAVQLRKKRSKPC